jgi:hypothetical protein
MGHASDPHFVVLHALKIKGFAESDVLTELTGFDHPTVTSHLDLARDTGLALRREGRICGWALTPEGRARHGELLEADLVAAGDSVQSTLSEAYQRFSGLNGRFKVVCTDWQLRPSGGQHVPNDHLDEEYDHAVIATLGAINDAVQPLCEEMAASLPRMRPYGGRLAAAHAKLVGGDRDAFTRPLANSYHDIWMELHEDLIATLKLARTAADA